MDYSEAIEFLYSSLPAFHNLGPGAYKPGLDTARMLNRAFGSPAEKLRAIHIAGTNGKGSTAHSIAAVLQTAGYRVGLYTSPHIADFRERIRISGQMIPQERVADFVERYRRMDLDCSPSFFELTTIMAFEYFCDEKVDVAVIETGLGGRLDTTNIITPLLSVITNISLDHTSLLGHTPAEIAREKAGIIKRGVPVVIGEADDEVAEVFRAKAAEENADIIFATAVDACFDDSGIEYKSTRYGDFKGELAGEYQIKNTATILAALQCLEQHFEFSSADVSRGLGAVTALTGLAGRWMKLSDAPLTICDTGHNPGGWSYITAQLTKMNRHVRLVAGFVADKDVSEIVRMIASLPSVTLYATQPTVHRRLPVEELAAIAADAGVKYLTFEKAEDAYSAAMKDCNENEMVFVGGSNYLVSDLEVV